MDERAATLIHDKLAPRPNNAAELEKKLNILTEKINRKNLQHDPLVHAPLEAESTVHSITAQVGAYFTTGKYNNCIDALNPFFKQIERAPYLNEYITLTEIEYNNLADRVLQDQIIAFTKNARQRKK